MQKFTRIAALLLVVVAVILAIAAFGLGRRAAQSNLVAQAPANAAPASAGQTVQAATTSIVVAANALPAGQPIAAASLQLAPAAQALPEGYTSVDGVAGDVPLVDIPAGSAITANLLAHGVAMALKPGERALAVPVDEQSSAGSRILPGDYVDVFLNLKSASPEGYVSGSKPLPSQARLLVSRLRVLAFGSHDLPKPVPSAHATATDDKAADKAAAATNENQVARTAVLAVPLADVDRLLLGTQDGKLVLALRHPGDPGQPDDTLFPQPRDALSPVAMLTPEQRQALQSPENRAFAGIDGLGLAGQAHASPPATARTARNNSPRVEIIRGAQTNSL
ncbi:Flp pilus assembly protein CpaB [Rhodanobacter sp. DHG33]|uniref:Flp pilus assembly protein CpaB n=1 Tax=Rhodanobacter sp. DHG33 TaxID=2775921 RepID=UPI001782FA8C|nr:Flp pilus assembly protein CpaB [Rhodanobacter sp. DHG33]MBD8898938.1 Flp pilus assembly protein CpaB [Rhodanobacter sp. DHG33]